MDKRIRSNYPKEKWGDIDVFQTVAKEILEGIKPLGESFFDKAEKAITTSDEFQVGDEEERRKQAAKIGAEQAKQLATQGMDEDVFNTIIMHLQDAKQEAETLQSSVEIAPPDAPVDKRVQSLENSLTTISERVRYALETLESLSPAIEDVRAAKIGIDSAGEKLNTMEKNHNAFSKMFLCIPKDKTLEDYIAERMGAPQAGTQNQDIEKAVAQFLVKHSEILPRGDEIAKEQLAELEKRLNSRYEKAVQTIAEKLKTNINEGLADENFQQRIAAKVEVPETIYALDEDEVKRLQNLLKSKSYVAAIEQTARKLEQRVSQIEGCLQHEDPGLKISGVVVPPAQAKPEQKPIAYSQETAISEGFKLMEEGLAKLESKKGD